MGTAGRAQARSPPGTAALKSEPGAARLVRRAGGGAGANAGRGRRWGGACRPPAPRGGAPAAVLLRSLAWGFRARRPAEAGVPWERPEDATPHTARCPEGRPPGASSRRSSDPQVLWLLFRMAFGRRGDLVLGQPFWGGGPSGPKWAASCTLTLETPALGKAPSLPPRAPRATYEPVGQSEAPEV